jgi:processive 1,2-diacylglycerol beta-glucosyltransferase
MRPRAVVLSGSLGMGHDVVAERVNELLAAAGLPATVLDSMALLGPRGSRSGERAFRMLIGAGGAYDLLYFAHLRPGGRVAGLMDALAARQLLPALRAEFARLDPSLVVSLFATAGSAAARLKPERPGMRTVVFCADAAAHRMWVRPGTDLYLVTSPAAAASVRRYQPDAAVRVVPPPLRRAFADPPDRASARARHGVPGAARCALVMGGGWGLGPVAEATRRLAGAGVHVLAVAGRNRPLAEQLERLAAGDERVHPYGFTDRVAELMAAADAVLTVPGATTCAEARAVGRRLVLIDALPGHGRENVQRELEAGDAEVTGPAPGEVVAVALALLARTAGQGDPAPAGGDWAGPLADALELTGAGLGCRAGPTRRPGAGAPAAAPPAGTPSDR